MFVFTLFMLLGWYRKVDSILIDGAQLKRSFLQKTVYIYRKQCSDIIALIFTYNDCNSIRCALFLEV